MNEPDRMDRIMEFDRTVFKRLPGIHTYVRQYITDEFPENPLHHKLCVTGITRMNTGIRLRRCLPSAIIDDPGERRGLFADMQGVVYFVRRRDEIKIGLTDDLPRRLGQLHKTFSIDGVLHYILTDNIKRLEKSFHRLFAPSRMSGEWFRLDVNSCDWVTKIAAVYYNPIEPFPIGNYPSSLISASLTAHQPD